MTKIRVKGLCAELVVILAISLVAGGCADKSREMRNTANTTPSGTNRVGQLADTNLESKVIKIFRNWCLAHGGVPDKFEIYERSSNHWTIVVDTNTTFERFYDVNPFTKKVKGGEIE